MIWSQYTRGDTTCTNNSKQTKHSVFCTMTAICFFHHVSIWRCTTVYNFPGKSSGSFHLTTWCWKIHYIPRILPYQCFAQKQLPWNLYYKANKFTKFLFLVLSCSCLCPIHWSQVVGQEWRCSWSSAERWFSNSEWSTILSSTKMPLMLEVWCMCFFHHVRVWRCIIVDYFPGK